MSRALSKNIKLSPLIFIKNNFKALEVIQTNLTGIEEYFYKNIY